jgi:hypothetical protein
MIFWNFSTAGGGAMALFRLPILMLAVGGVAFVLFGDSFLVIISQTAFLLGALIWERFRPQTPPHSNDSRE